MLNKRLILKITLNSFLGLILIFVWSRFVNFNALISTLKTVNLIYVLFFLGVIILSGFIRSLRLKLLLNSHQINLKDIMMLNFLSQFLSFLIPIRAGEVAKSVYLTTQFKLPLAKALVLVFIDRFLDFWIVIFTIGMFLPFVSTNLPPLFINLVFILLLFITLITVFSIKNEKFMKKTAIFLSNFLVFNNIKKSFVIFIYTVIDGFEVLKRSPRDMSILLILSFIGLLCDSLIWIIVFRSLGFKLEPLTGLVGNSLSALTFLIPSAPGYVGSAEAAVLGVFSGILGLPVNITTASSVLFHILTMLALLILGISSLYFLKFDLGLVWKKLRKED